MGRSFLPWMDELLLFGNKTSGIKGHLTGVHFTTLGEHSTLTYKVYVQKIFVK